MMAPSKKYRYPTSPIAGLYGEMDNLDILSDISDQIPVSTSFSSKCFADDNTVSSAEEIFDKITKNQKGKPLFKSKNEFLRQLDGALFDYEMFRDCVMPDESGDLNSQKNYFKRLEKSVRELNIVLNEMCDNHSRRLAAEGFVLPQKYTPEGLDNDFIKKSKSLEDATIKVIKDLKGTNSGKNLELYLLIEQLISMYESCTGKKATITNKGYPNKSKSPFFILVNEIYQIVPLSNKSSITENSIIDGITLVKKGY